MSSSKRILVLGATGFLGQSVFSTLKQKGHAVVGTSLHQGDEGTYIPLDTTIQEQLDALDWSLYDIVIDCTGVVDYSNTLTSFVSTLAVNALAPLSTLKHLHSKQRYVYCSTHAVLLPPLLHSGYVLSKYYFEEMITHAVDVHPSVTILRIPGIFFENRKEGLLYKIKNHFQEGKALELSIDLKIWHAMYLPRVSQVIAALLGVDARKNVVTIGYPCAATIEQIISIAKNTFGRSIPISYSKNESNGYIPDTSAQEAFIQLQPKDYVEDLTTYFKR